MQRADAFIYLFIFGSVADSLCRDTAVSCHMEAGNLGHARCRLRVVVDGQMASENRHVGTDSVKHQWQRKHFIKKKRKNNN